MALSNNNPLTPEQEFLEAENYKAPYLANARRQASVTKPGVCPPDITTPAKGAPLHQSVGPDVIDKLVNQQLMTIFPVTMPICKITLPAEATQEELRSASLLEAAISLKFWSSQIPLKVCEHLQGINITSDSVMLIDAKKGKGKVYRLPDYVKVITHTGDLQTLILRDYLSYQEITQEEYNKEPKNAEGEVQNCCRQHNKYLRLNFEYTRFERIPKTNKFKKTVNRTREPEEIEEEEIIKEENLGILHFEWDTSPVTSYGSGCPAEQAYEDLEQITKMNIALTNQLNGATRHLIGIDPASAAMNSSQVDTAESGEVIPAKIGELYAIQLYDPKAIEIWMRAIADKKMSIEATMGIAPSNFGDRERITKAEVDIVSRSKMGKHGYYYLKAEHYIQKPIIDMLVNTLEIKALGVNYDIKPNSGFAATQQLSKVDSILTWGKAVAEFLAQPAMFESIINIDRFAYVLAESLNLNLSNIYMTSSEKKEAEKKKLIEAATNAALNNPALLAGQPQPTEGNPYE